MYIPVGGNVLLRSADIVGIFDTDSTTVSVHSRSLLNAAQKENRVCVVSEYELPRSFLLVRENGEIKVYLSPVAAGTLIHRIKK